MQNWEDILLIGAHGNNIHEYEMSFSLLPALAAITTNYNKNQDVPANIFQDLANKSAMPAQASSAKLLR